MSQALPVAVRRLRHERDAGRTVEQRRGSGRGSGAARRTRSGKRLELRAPERGEDVAHPVVEADLEVLVVGDRLAGLRRELAGVLDEVAVLRDEHPAAARRDDLVAVERERGRGALSARGRAAIRRPERLGGVLDEDDVVAVAHRADRRRSRSTARRGRRRRRHGRALLPRAAPRSRGRAGPGPSSRSSRRSRRRTASRPCRRSRSRSLRTSGPSRRPRRPAPIPSTTSARWSAAVPLESATAWATPATAASSRSKASTCGPSGAIQFDSIASATSSASRPDEVGWGEVDARHRAPSVPARGAGACVDGDTSAMTRARHGLPRVREVRAGRPDLRARADHRATTAGAARRTLVWVEGIPEPVVASRTQETILAEIEAIADPSSASRRSRSRRGALRVHPQLFEE